MALFNAEDIENADEDPFGLSLDRKRHTCVIAKSEEDSAEWDKDGDHFESAIWKITFADEEDERTQDLTYFLDGDDKQVERTNGNIKAMLLSLDIPRDRWSSVASNPEEIVGLRVVVEVGKSAKTGRKWLNVKGLAKADDIPAGLSKSKVENAAVANGAPASNPFLNM